MISTSSLFAGLTDKHLMALLSAVGNGYYRVPKKITTAHIADIMGVPRTTFEEHLRKAESKILGSVAPYLQLKPRRVAKLFMPQMSWQKLRALDKENLNRE